MHDASFVCSGLPLYHPREKEPPRKFHPVRYIMPHIQTPQNTWCHCILSCVFKYLRFGLKELYFKSDTREKKEATFASSSCYKKRRQLLRIFSRQKRKQHIHKYRMRGNKVVPAGLRQPLDNQACRVLGSLLIPVDRSEIELSVQLLCLKLK